MSTIYAPLAIGAASFHSSRFRLRSQSWRGERLETPDGDASASVSGDFDGQADINVSGRATSSSLLPVLPMHVAASPESSYIGKEGVRIIRLDSLWGTSIEPGARVFLKVDVQGYEKRVLEGAGRVLPAVMALELELSFFSLYEGSSLAYEILGI